MAIDELQRLRLMRNAIERLHKEMDNAGGIDPYWLQAVDDAIGVANGELRAPVLDSAEHVEVPVTRRARVTLVSCSELRPGDRFVARPVAGAPFRQGIATVTRTWNGVGCAIVGLTEHDLLYRVEPE